MERMVSAIFLLFLGRNTHCVDEGDTIDVLFLDSQKAFDKVPLNDLWAVATLQSHGLTVSVARSKHRLRSG